MQTSLRSYLTMGTATVVGAGAIALTPALPANPMHNAHLPAPAVAEVSLTGLSISLPDILGVLQNFGGGGLLPDLGGLPPDLVKAVVVEFVKEASPVVKATAGDVFQYVNGAIMGLVFGPDSIPVRFGSAIAEFPAVVKTALGDIKDGDIPAALQALNAGLFAPVKSIGEVLFETANGIKTYVTAQVGTLVAAIPGILMSAIAAVIGNNTQDLFDTIKDTLAGLFQGGALAMASVPAPALVTAPETGVVDATAAADSAPAPRAAASVAAEADSAEAEPAAEAEAAAPQADPEAAAPVTRPRAAEVRSTVAEEVANGPAVTARPKQNLRGARNSVERSKAAASHAE